MLNQYDAYGKLSANHQHAVIVIVGMLACC